MPFGASLGNEVDDIVEQVSTVPRVEIADNLPPPESGFLFFVRDKECSREVKI